MRTLFALLLLSFPLVAQTPYLVKDINTTYAHDTASSKPRNFVKWRNRTYFVATLEEQYGTELWSTDGTSGGTSIVADLIPGSGSSNPASLKVVNDVLLFTARSVNHGIEIWTTDGTAAGTRMLADLNPGPSSAQPFFSVSLGNRLFFTADDGANGRELWVTDGTAAGTRLVKDLEPGPASSFPRSLVVFRNSVYLLTTNALWKTDGTDAGTTQVATVSGSGLTVAGSQMFFAGYTTATNHELWVSDGTEAGTRMLPEILPGGKGGLATQYTSVFVALGNGILFAATDDVHGRELWTSDGTAAGTRMVLDALPGAKGLFDAQFFWAVIFGDRAWFPGMGEEHGRELWSSDGTAAGTAMFLDVHPGPMSSYASPVGIAGGKLLFSAISGLWVTDGTAAGTRVLRTADGAAITHDSDEFPPQIVDGHFAGRTHLTGTEPWITDGTDAGTRIVANLAKDRSPSSFPGLFAATENLLFFHAADGMIASSGAAEVALWRTDGTDAGTFKLRESRYPSPLTAAGQYVFFFDQPNRYEPMMSDGTVSGTKPVTEFQERFGGREIEALYPFGSTLFASVNDGTFYENALWVTQAVPNAPAVRLGARNPYGFVELAGRYLFYARAEASVHDRGLWITDGTPAGTYAVVPDLDASYGDVSELTTAAGMAWFLAARDGETALWKSDGTLDGTVAVKAVPVGSGVALQGAGDRVFFMTRDALWTSDGTEAGTIEVTKADFGFDEILKPAGNRAVFVRYDRSTSTHELWTSDGTAAGTKLLRELGHSAIAAIDGLVYFAGTDDAHGTEPWTTDGTLEGTKLLVDLNPGPASSTPGNFTKLGNTLYFSGYTDATGDELWALPLNEPRVSIADARALESASIVRFTVSLEGPPAQAVTLDYATADVNARAGQDYEATSGTLTFSPGETAKTIDVRILGDTAAENNEMFRLALGNVTGARVVHYTAIGIIDDDDAAADLSVAVELTGGSSDISEGVLIANAGPRGATDVDVVYTSIPGDDQACWECVIPQIPTGGTARSYPRGASTLLSQVYRSAIVKARQPDPNASNNAVSWTVNEFGDVAMNAAFLTPEATATVSVLTDSYFTTPVPISSDAAVVSISSAITKKDDTLSTFTVTALKPGTSSITVGAWIRPLLVTVVAAGTTPRWPHGLEMDLDRTYTRVHQPVMLSLTPLSRAPVSGATATGIVTVTAGGQEIARHNVTGTVPLTIPLYFRTLGTLAVKVAYTGDANFLPQTQDATVRVDSGSVTITGLLERDLNTDGTFLLRVRVEGARGIAPTGSVSVFHHSAFLKELPLRSNPDGTATAETTLSNLPPSPTLTLRYNGDALYHSVDQQVRLPETRRRNVRH